MGKIIKSLSRLIASLTRKNSQIWQVLVISPLGLAHHYPDSLPGSHNHDHGFLGSWFVPRIDCSSTSKEYIPKNRGFIFTKNKIKMPRRCKESENTFWQFIGAFQHVFRETWRAVTYFFFFQYSQVLYIYYRPYFILSFDDKFSVLKKLEQNFKKES